MAAYKEERERFGEKENTNDTAPAVVSTFCHQFGTWICARENTSKRNETAANDNRVTNIPRANHQPQRSCLNARDNHRSGSDYFTLVCRKLLIARETFFF